MCVCVPVSMLPCTDIHTRAGARTCIHTHARARARTHTGVHARAHTRTRARAGGLGRLRRRLPIRRRGRLLTTAAGHVGTRTERAARIPKFSQLRPRSDIERVHATADRESERGPSARSLRSSQRRCGARRHRRGLFPARWIDAIASGATMQCVPAAFRAFDPLLRPSHSPAESTR